MNNLPARTGLDWVRQGFRLFFSQPGILMSLMFGFLLLTLLMSIIPVLKVVAILVLNAVYPSIFLGAVAEVDAGRRVTGAALRSRFSKQALGRQTAGGAQAQAGQQAGKVGQVAEHLWSQEARHRERLLR